MRRAWGGLILEVALTGQTLWTVRKGRDTGIDGGMRAEGRGSPPRPSCPTLQLRGGAISAAGVLWPKRVLNTCDLYIDFLQMQEREISWHLGAK